MYGAHYIDTLPDTDIHGNTKSPPPPVRAHFGCQLEHTSYSSACCVERATVDITVKCHRPLPICFLQKHSVIEVRRNFMIPLSGQTLHHIIYICIYWQTTGFLHTASRVHGWLKCISQYWHIHRRKILRRIIRKPHRGFHIQLTKRLNKGIRVTGGSTRRSQSSVRWALASASEGVHACMAPPGPCHHAPQVCSD